MDLFIKLFENFIQFTYSCFDRIILNGYIVSLLRAPNVVYFFKEIAGISKIDKGALSKRTEDYNKWIESYSKNNEIPIKWGEKNTRNEVILEPYLEKMKRNSKTGVYFIFKSMEIGTTFRSVSPKYETKDPNYCIIKKHRSRFTHYYFYIYDEVLGNMSIKVGSYFPFNTTYYLNPHNYIEQELMKSGIDYTKKENAFLSPSDNNIIQDIADKLTPEIIRKRLDYWSFVVTPKFSQKERNMMDLNRSYYIAQIEYSVNFIFKKDFKIKELFQRACQSGIIHLAYDKISSIYGHRITRRTKGKLSTTLEKFNKSMHIFRVHFKNSFLKQYHKCSRFLRNELVCNDLRNFGLKKSLDNLQNIKKHFAGITDHFAEFQSHLYNINFSSEIFNQLSKPVLSGKVKVPGIKIENDRIVRLLEFLLRFASGVNIFRSKDIYKHLLETYDITEKEYTFNQLQYDIRKLKAHGIIEKIAKTHNYRLTDFGISICILFALFRKNIYGPLQNQQFVFKPKNCTFHYNSKFETIYKKIDKNIDQLFKVIAA